MTLEGIARRLGRSVADVESTIERANLATTLRPETHTVHERGRKLALEVTRRGVGRLKIGKRIAHDCEVVTTLLDYFEQFDFAVGDQWEKYSVIVLSPLSNALQPTIFPDGPILLRIDSGCETGQLFGDMTCECRDQLERALEHKEIAERLGVTVGNCRLLLHRAGEKLRRAFQEEGAGFGSTEPRKSPKAA